MPSLMEYFNQDFKELSIDKPLEITIENRDGDGHILESNKVTVLQKVRHETNSSCRFLTYYIPILPSSFGAIKFILESLQIFINELEGFDVHMSISGDKEIGIDKTFYSNRIYFYIETPLSDEELGELRKLINNSNIHITIRDKKYIDTRMESEKPMAFISHDSRNKDLIARPLALGLNSRLCFVWYDEYSLKVGDSLRESIEKGIKDAQKCIIILTKEFLSNPGWTKKEFNSIFTREMITKERVVIPIWYGVSPMEVYEYSPSLADTVALTWPTSEGKSKDDYNKEVETLISKLHTAITSIKPDN